MAASANDLFMEVGDPGTATTLSAPGYTSGGTSITVGSTSGWPTATGVTFAIDEAEVVNGVEVQVAGTYNEYAGTVNTGTSVTNISWQRGVGDRNYSAGALTRVYIPVSAERENRLVEGMLVSHDQDGTLKTGAVDNANILSANTVDSAAYVDNSIDAEHLATNALKLGYASITTNFTTASTSAVQVTGLTATVTIPSGGRSIKITAFSRALYSTSSGAAAKMTIWDGVVGSGTQLNESFGLQSGGAGASNGFVQAIVTPTAGSKTYNIGLAASSGTATLEAGTTFPAFIFVEVV